MAELSPPKVQLSPEGYRISVVIIPFRKLNL